MVSKPSVSAVIRAIPPEELTKSNFGKKGWSLVLFCGLMLFFSTGTSVDGLNVTVEGLASLNNWSVPTLLGFSTVSGLVSIAGMFVFGLICDRIGARKTAIIALTLGGASYIWYGNARTLTEYAVALCLVCLFANVHAWIAGGAYLSAWFPRKNGIALGWAAMGNNLASAFIVPILTGLAALLGGVQYAITAVGVAIVLSAVWAIFLPDKPENAGATPDNVPMSSEVIEAYRREANAYVSPWTFKKLVRTKQFWQISIGLGLYMLVTVGVMSQLVPRMVEKGMTQSHAIMTMTVCALVGMGGSYLWGVLNQKLTTRVAASLYGVWYAVAIFFNVLPGTTCLYISVFMIGIAIGGNAHWPVSLVCNSFGHQNFAKIYSLANPCISIIRMCSFSVLAVALSVTGTLTGAYVVFIALSLIAGLLVWCVNDKQYADSEVENVNP